MQLAAGTTSKPPRSINGQFTPGHSGNPAGRPKGARNRATLFAEMLREGQSEALIQALVERALGGDQVALRFCVARIVPKPGPATIELALPPGAESDPDAVVTAAIRAMADGGIAPQEAATIARVVVAAHKVKGVERRCVAEPDVETASVPEAATPREMEAPVVAGEVPLAAARVPVPAAAPAIRLLPAAVASPTGAAPFSFGRTTRSVALATTAPVSGHYFPDFRRTGTAHGALARGL